MSSVTRSARPAIAVGLISSKKMLSAIKPGPCPIVLLRPATVKKAIVRKQDIGKMVIAASLSQSIFLI